MACGTQVEEMPTLLDEQALEAVPVSELPTLPASVEPEDPSSAAKEPNNQDLPPSGASAVDQLGVHGGEGPALASEPVEAENEDPDHRDGAHDATQHNMPQVNEPVMVVPNVEMTEAEIPVELEEPLKVAEVPKDNVPINSQEHAEVQVALDQHMEKENPEQSEAHNASLPACQDAADKHKCLEDNSRGDGHEGGGDGNELRVMPAEDTRKTSPEDGELNLVRRCSSATIDRCSTQSMESDVGTDPAAMLEGLCDSLELADGELSQIDELVLKPCPLKGWENETAAMELHTCLQEHFSKGLSTLEELMPHVIVWMQQLVLTPLNTVWSFDLGRGVNAYASMRKASEAFDEKIKSVEARRQAVAKAALRSFSDTARETAKRINKDAILDGKSRVLCKWVRARQAECQYEVEEAHRKHDASTRTFKEEVTAMLSTAFQNYERETAVPVIDEEDLFSTLNDTVLSSLAQPPEEVAPKETPETAVPSVAGVQDLVDTAMSAIQSQISDAQRELLSRGLHKVLDPTNQAWLAVIWKLW